MLCFPNSWHACWWATLSLLFSLGACDCSSDSDADLYFLSPQDGAQLGLVDDVPQYVADLEGKAKAVEQQIAFSAATTKFQEELERIRAETVGFTKDRTIADSLYAPAFHDAGLDLQSLSEEELVERIKKSEIKEGIISAMDNWSQITLDSQVRRRLNQIANLADTNEWRRNVRDALATKNIERLKTFCCCVCFKLALSARLRKKFDFDSTAFLTCFELSVQLSMSFSYTDRLKWFPCLPNMFFCTFLMSKPTFFLVSFLFRVCCGRK